jgi:hypothetical protein
MRAHLLRVVEEMVIRRALLHDVELREVKRTIITSAGLPILIRAITAVNASFATARRRRCWKYVLESTGFDPLVGSDGFDPLWCKSPNGPQML